MSPVRPATAMFHTFQGLAPPKPQSSHPSDVPKPSGGGSQKRITTPHACAECKRRKIRCDGRQPCGQCLGCRSPKPCYYDKHRQRVIPSRKTLDALSQSLEECRTILRRLYPTRDPQSLTNLSRKYLIALLDHPESSIPMSDESPTGPASSSSPRAQDLQTPGDSPSDDDRSLANLELVPSHDMEYDEERRNREPIPEESDDVNGLSMSVDQQSSSYLGASSIKAAFLVMLRVAPSLKGYIGPPTGVNRQQLLGQTEHSSLPRQQYNRPAKPQQKISWSSEGQTLIDAYFNRVHLFIPMLDEPSFRRNYLGSERDDAPWLALLNMVFAMGSMAANKSDDHTHLRYYEQAKGLLDLDSLGSGHLETLQALGIMGGYYLHYINRPNMAHAVMGAALRMATALGLHKEVPGSVSPGGENDSSAKGRYGNGLDGTNGISPDIRRRTWWSLFCLDTWASTTLGRPSMRWSKAVTILPPQEDEEKSQKPPLLPLVQNRKFCLLATSIQDLLATNPFPSVDDRNHYDAALLSWYNSLPSPLQSNDPCPEILSTVRNVMEWRLLNLRMYLHRPVLFAAACKSASCLAQDDSSSPSSPRQYISREDMESVQQCREIAKQTIEMIESGWTRNQMSGWNAVWFLYQASMIPLVSLFWEYQVLGSVANSRESKYDIQRMLAENEDLQDWKRQIETCIRLFAAMADWSLAARRSGEVVSKVYESSKHLEQLGRLGVQSQGKAQAQSPHPGLRQTSSSHSLHGHNHSISSMEGIETGLQHTHVSQHAGPSSRMYNTNPAQYNDFNNTMEEDMMFLENGGIWDLDGMLWSSNAIEMPYAIDPFQPLEGQWSGPTGPSPPGRWEAGPGPAQASSDASPAGTGRWGPSQERINSPGSDGIPRWSQGSEDGRLMESPGLQGGLPRFEHRNSFHEQQAQNQGQTPGSAPGLQAGFAQHRRTSPGARMEYEGGYMRMG